MVKIKVIGVGKIKEKGSQLLIDEYAKRLKGYCKLEIVELLDEKIGDNASLSQKEQIKSKEGKKIIEKIKDNEYVIVLDLKGKNYSSEEMAANIETVSTYKSSDIIFVIGGSLGLSQEVIDRSNDSWCLSRATFPHQIVRILLLEQIYRCFKINNNETYHK